MEIENLQFVLDNLFHKHGECYWRECIGDGEGYIVILPDGETLHTYHYPPEFLWLEAEKARIDSLRKS